MFTLERETGFRSAPAREAHTLAARAARPDCGVSKLSSNSQAHAIDGSPEPRITPATAQSPSSCSIGGAYDEVDGKGQHKAHAELTWNGNE
jgi:hypothetical protein